MKKTSILPPIISSDTPFGYLAQIPAMQQTTIKMCPPVKVEKGSTVYMPVNGAPFIVVVDPAGNIELHKGESNAKA